MHRLCKKCIVAESQVKQLKHEKTLLGFGTNEDGENKEKLLRFFKQEAKTLRMQITEKVRQQSLQRRLHSRATLTSKQFWRLVKVKRTVKKKGMLTAVKDIK